MDRRWFPHPQGMPSFWLQSAGPLDRHRSTPELPEQTDVLIIGSGYSAGALVTHLIEKTNQQQPSVLVLEARQFCSGATGRNGGHLKPDGYYAITRYADMYGVEAAAEVAEFEIANVKAVSKYLADEKVDCDFVMTEAIDVQLSSDLSKRIKEGYDKLVMSGVQSARATVPVPEEMAEKVSGVKGAKSCYTYPAGHLWPYKMVHHMFTKAISKGVNLQTETRVTSISDIADADGFWTVTTDRGEVKAKTVILTTNAYTSAILSEYRNRIIPYRAVCCRIQCSGPAPPLYNTYALRFADWDFDYLIPRPDGSIVVGGARKAYLNHLEDWYGNTDDSKVIERARHYFDGYMQRHFHGWEGSDAQVSQIWTGIMGYSSDRLPRVGAIPKRPGMFIMAGFTGHGMPQIFLCAKGIAAMVKRDVPFAETGIPRLFQESEARLKDSRNQVQEIYHSIPLQTNL